MGGSVCAAPSLPALLCRRRSQARNWVRCIRMGDLTPGLPLWLAALRPAACQRRILATSGGRVCSLGRQASLQDRQALGPRWPRCGVGPSADGRTAARGFWSCLVQASLSGMTHRGTSPIPCGSRCPRVSQPRCRGTSASWKCPTCSVLKNFGKVACRVRWTRQRALRSSTQSLAAVLGYRQSIWRASFLWLHHRCHQQHPKLLSTPAPCYVTPQEGMHSLRTQRLFDPHSRAS